MVASTRTLNNFELVKGIYAKSDRGNDLLAIVFGGKKLWKKADSFQKIFKGPFIVPMLNFKFEKEPQVSYLIE